MAAPDYGYYHDTYRGTLGEADYHRLSRRAWAYLEQLTLGGVSARQPAAVADKVKDACCAVAEAMSANEKGGGVVSESNDGVSVTYAAASRPKGDGERLYEAAALYLAMTGLLYRGCGTC